MQKYSAKLQRYTIILTIITLIASGIFITCVLNNVSKMLLLTLFLLLFFALSSLISVIFMLYLPRLEKFLAKRCKNTIKAIAKNSGKPCQSVKTASLRQ